MARRRAGGRPVARDRRRARDTRTVGPPTARIAESLIKPFRKEEETANRWASWVGPVSRIAASFVPRGSQREAWLQPLRKHRLASNGNCIAGNQCERSGLSAKLLSNPFHGVIAYPEALFRRHLSRQSAELGDRRCRAPSENRPVAQHHALWTRVRQSRRVSQ
jgi:hypothetical protein